MKQIVIFLLVLFCAGGLFAENNKSSYAARQELKKVRRTIDKQLKKDKQAQIQQRREAILYNGNINNFYPRALKVEWIIINNRAYLIFRHYHSYYGYYNRYMRVG